MYNYNQLVSNPERLKREIGTFYGVIIIPKIDDIPCLLIDNEKQLQFDDYAYFSESLEKFLNKEFCIIYFPQIRRIIGENISRGFSIYGDENRIHEYCERIEFSAQINEYAIGNYYLQIDNTFSIIKNSMENNHEGCICPYDCKQIRFTFYKNRNNYSQNNCFIDDFKKLTEENNKTLELYCNLLHVRKGNGTYLVINNKSENKTYYILLKNETIFSAISNNIVISEIYNILEIKVKIKGTLSLDAIYPYGIETINIQRIVVFREGVDIIIDM